MASSLILVYNSKAVSLEALLALASFKEAFTLVLTEAISAFNYLYSASASASSFSSSFKDSEIESLNLVNSAVTFSKVSAEKVEEIYNKEAIGFNLPIFYN